MRSNQAGVAFALLMASAACAPAPSQPVQPPTPVVVATPPAMPAGPDPLPALATIAVAPAPAAIAAAGGWIYVGSAETGAIQALDPAKAAVVAEVPSPGGAASFLAPFPDGTHLFALDERAGTARIIDPAAQHAVTASLAVGARPTFAVLSPDDPTIVVALSGEARAVVLAWGVGARRGEPFFRRDQPVGTAAGARTLGYDHDWAIVPNAGDGSVTLIDLVKNAASTLPAGKALGDAHMGVWEGVARQAMVLDGDALALYAVPGGQRTTIEGLGRAPADLLADEGLRRAYVAMKGSDELAVVDYDKKRLFGKVATGAGPSALASVEALAPSARLRLRHEVDDAPREVWVGNEAGRSVTVVDATTLLVKATFAVGAGPHRFAFTADRAFVANRGDGTVSVLDRRAVPALP